MKGGFKGRIYINEDYGDGNSPYSKEKYYIQNPKAKSESIHRGGIWQDSNGQNHFPEISNYPKIWGVKENGKNGSYMGFSIGGAVGGGISLEAGFVTDSFGHRALYGNFAGNASMGAGLGFKGGVIEPNGKHNFRVEDWAGKGNSFSGMAGSLSYEKGGSVGKGGFEHFGEYDDKVQRRPYTYESGSQSHHFPSAIPVLKSFGFKLGIGGYISESRTGIIKID